MRKDTRQRRAETQENQKNSSLKSSLYSKTEIIEIWLQHYDRVNTKLETCKSLREEGLVVERDDSKPTRDPTSQLCRRATEFSTVHGQEDSCCIFTVRFASLSIHHDILFLAFFGNSTWDDRVSRIPKSFCLFPANEIPCISSDFFSTCVVDPFSERRRTEWRTEPAAW